MKWNLFSEDCYVIIKYELNDLYGLSSDEAILKDFFYLTNEEGYWNIRGSIKVNRDDDNLY